MSRPLADRDPLLLRTRLLRRLTATAGRREGAAARRYLRSGPVVVTDGLGIGLRLTGLSVGQAQAGQIVRGAVEPMVQEALRRQLTPGAVMYDVGGSVGFFSLLGARLGATVVAFEPLPGAAATIERNTALNGLSERVRVLELAAGDQEGRATLIEAGEAGWSHLADRGTRPDAHATHDVRVAALDDLVAAGEIGPPDLVKLDVEGSEGRGSRRVAPDDRASPAGLRDRAARDQRGGRGPSRVTRLPPGAPRRTRPGPRRPRRRPSPCGPI